MTQNDTEKKAAQPTIFRQLYGFHLMRHRGLEQWITLFFLSCQLFILVRTSSPKQLLIVIKKCARTCKSVKKVTLSFYNHSTSFIIEASPLVYISEKQV